MALLRNTADNQPEIITRALNYLPNLMPKFATGIGFSLNPSQKS